MLQKKICAVCSFDDMLAHTRGALDSLRAKAGYDVLKPSRSECAFYLRNKGGSFGTLFLVQVGPLSVIYAYPKGSDSSKEFDSYLVDVSKGLRARGVKLKRVSDSALAKEASTEGSHRRGQWAVPSPDIQLWLDCGAELAAAATQKALRSAAISYTAALIGAPGGEFDLWDSSDRHIGLLTVGMETTATTRMTVQTAPPEMLAALEAYKAAMARIGFRVLPYDADRSKARAERFISETRQTAAFRGEARSKPGTKPASPKRKAQLVKDWLEASANAEKQEVFCKRNGISTRQLRRYIQEHRSGAHPGLSPD